MTPEEAYDLLDGTTPGPWEWREGKDQNGEFVALCSPDGSDALRTWDGDLYASGVHGTDADKALAAAAPALAAMIAGMVPEYMALNRADEDGEWHQVTPWSTEWPFRPGHTPDPRFDKVIRRYVTEPEEA